MSKPALSPASRLIAAIDDLVAFVRSLFSTPAYLSPPLSAADIYKLVEFEGTVIGLLAMTAEGRIHFENHPPLTAPGVGSPGTELEFAL